MLLLVPSILARCGGVITLFPVCSSDVDLFPISCDDVDFFPIGGGEVSRTIGKVGRERGGAGQMREQEK